MPRFLLVSGVSRGGFAQPAWPDVASPLRGTTAADGSWVSWRLTGANHRELGRSVAVFPTAAETLEAVEQLRDDHERLAESVTASARDGRWTWRVQLGNDPVAISGRPYSRHRECLYNLEAFLAAVPVAHVVASVARRLATGTPRPRRATAAETVGPLDDGRRMNTRQDLLAATPAARTTPTVAVATADSEGHAP